MRTVLYANRELSAYLRENYVLAWTSERPVPRVTIDFGDGRVLERTLTGNAAHYVLDSQGRPLDVLPGLYEPGTFMKVLESLQELHRSLAGMQGDAWQSELRAFHDGRYPASSDFGSQVRFDRSRDTGTSPLDDREMLRVIASLDLTSLDRQPVTLDRRSVVLMARELTADERMSLTPEEITRVHKETRPFPRAESAGARTSSKASFELPVLRSVESDTSFQALVRTFMETLAMDTYRNEFEFRHTIRGWFAGGEVTDFESLNERVYREIFLTPRDDPWLGLKSENTYSALHQADTQN